MKTKKQTLKADPLPTDSLAGMKWKHQNDRNYVNTSGGVACIVRHACVTILVNRTEIMNIFGMGAVLRFPFKQLKVATKVLLGN